MRRVRFLSTVLLLVFLGLCLCTASLAQSLVPSAAIKTSAAKPVSEQPDVIVRGTPTPSPIPQPTVTPTPSPVPEPTATPLPTPNLWPMLDLASGIKIQWGELPEAQAFCIYRAETSDGPYTKIHTTEQHSRSYTDAQIAANTEYWYYVTSVINGAESLPSEKGHLAWTQRSNISHLRITLDSANIRRFTIAWDDVTDSEYQVSVYLLDTKKDESWYWSGMTTTDHSMDYEYALPNTSYQIVVREVVTEQELTETVKIPSAPSYKDYGCKSKGASLKLINRYDLNRVDPWDADGQKISAIKRSALADTFGGSDLYYISTFTYTKASQAHSVSELFVVRTPSGKVYYQDNSGHQNQFDGEEKNWTWTWYSPVDSVLYDLGNSYDDWEKGKYTIEQYFNGCLVNATTLTIR